MIGAGEHFAETAPATAEEEAYAYIFDRIRRGVYHPGDRLKAEDIASAINMSRMPVREAFRRLATEGLLLLRPNRGAIVRTLTLDDIEEIFEMRAVLEGLAVRLAVPNVTDIALRELEYLLDRMEQTWHIDSGEWLAAHRRFHEYVCGLSGRQRLMRQISGLHTALEPYLRLWFIHSNPPVSDDVQREHQQIIEALRHRDPERVEKVMQQHIITTSPNLAGVL